MLHYDHPLNSQLDRVNLLGKVFTLHMGMNLSMLQCGHMGEQ